MHRARLNLCWLRSKTRKKSTFTTPIACILLTFLSLLGWEAWPRNEPPTKSTSSRPIASRTRARSLFHDVLRKGELARFPQRTEIQIQESPANTSLTWMKMLRLKRCCKRASILPKLKLAKNLRRKRRQKCSMKRLFHNWHLSRVSLTVRSRRLLRRASASESCRK